MSCELCDLPTPNPPVTADDADGAFCCRGCLEVARVLGDDADVDVDGDAVRDALDESSAGADATGDTDTDADADADADTATAGDCEEAFLAVEGMHCATCEAFVEGTATAEDGVVDAEASYAADMVKLTYDPDAVARDRLTGIVDGLGYRATEVDAGADTDDGESVGRLLVGGFFGMMVMVWYALFLYPAYIGVNPELLLFELSGTAGRFLLANVWVMATVVLCYTGYPILRGAYVSLRSGYPNMDLLVAVAAVNASVYSAAAVLVGRTEVYFDVAVVVVLAVTIGNYYESKVKRRAANLLADLTRERVSEARRRTAEGTETVPVEALEPGDELVVAPGERVPVDATVVEGAAAVDESLVTGESLPVPKSPGDDLVGGSVVTDDALVAAVGEDAESTLDRLVTVLWSVQSSRSGGDRLADRLAAVFVPLVLAIAAVAVGWQLVAGASATDALLTGLAVLVVSCPCALGLATPLAVASGVREALSAGVVVTDESVFERATDTDVVAFDKTGTLTTGEMRVVDAADDAAMARAAAVEQFSDHPVAGAVTTHTAPPDGAAAADSFARHPGRGVEAVVDGERVLAGRPVLFEERDWPVAESLRERVATARDAGRVAVVVGWDGRARDLVVVGDEPRPEWEATVADLATDAEVVVVTGDSDRAAERFRDHPDVEAVFAGVPPEAKAEVVERLRARGTVAMVGDGSNDAPALGSADLGIAFGDATALAADAADAVVTDRELDAVSTVFDVTAATRRRVRENLGWALCYNAIAVPLAATGNINPLLAAVAMATSSLLVVGNSSRSLLE